MSMVSGNSWNVAVKQHSIHLPLLNTPLLFIVFNRSTPYTYTRHKRDQFIYLSSDSIPKTMPSIASMAIGGLMSLSLVANALPQITRSGKYLYEPDGTRFYIKVGHLRERITKLTCRVSLTNLKVPSQSRAPPTLRSESFLCFRVKC